MKEKFINYFMHIAEATAELSYATRLKVGAVLVQGDKILATGYNGTPRGADNVAEYRDYYVGNDFTNDAVSAEYPYIQYDLTESPRRYALRTKKTVIHAESNCIMKVAISTESSMGTTMFCTHAPCLDCAKLIYQAGIKSLYYRNSYRNQEGLLLLKEMGLNINNV